MFVRNLVSLLPVLASLANAVPVDQLNERGGDYHNDDSCVNWGGGVKYADDHIPTTIIKVITTQYVHFPVFVDQYCDANTILNFYGDVKINVYNAPTHIRTIATGWSTATYTALTTVLPHYGGGEINIYEKKQVNYFPLTVNTYIQNNGIFQIGGQNNVIINNAPTSISTVVNGTTTVTSTVTVTTTQTVGRPTAFIIALARAGPGQKVRRQAGAQYLGGGGQIVNSCSDAVILTITNGQLSNNGQLYSTNAGSAFAKFASSEAIGAISTTFTNSVQLSWANAAFSGGAARFCALTGVVYSIFSGNNLPGCLTQDLLVIRSDLCNNGVIVSSSTTSGASTSGAATSSRSSTSGASTSGTATSTSGSTSASGSTSNTASTSATATTTASTSASTSGSVSSSTTSFTSTASTSTTSASSTSTAPPVCLLANFQQLNTAGTACQCIANYANSSGTTTLNCTPVPDCTTGPNQVLDPVSNTCRCKPLYADANPNAAILDCTFTPNCDASAKQVLDIPTNACKCLPGFVDLIPGLPLICSPDCTLSPFQVLNPAGTACICAPLYADSLTTDSILTCTLTPTCTVLGQVLDIVTNTCKCNSALGFANINPLGTLTCAVCLIGIQVLNPVTNVCSCAPPKTNFALAGLPLLCL